MVGKEIVDLRNNGNHPLQFKYSEIFKSAILNANLEDGRSQPGFSLTGNSPFVKAAQVGLLNDINSIESYKEMFQVFEQYYNIICVKHAAQWFGLNVNSKFNEVKPWGAVFPWRARSIDSYQHAYENAAINENLSCNINSGIELGWLFNGPVSEIKIDIEVKRMIYVIKQILLNGYQRNDGLEGDANATILVNNNNEWRWILTGGNHRASASSAIGLKQIPIRINLVIRRDEVAFWPHVINGNFTIQEALSIFDSYYFAKPLIDTRLWDVYVDSLFIK